MKITRRQLRKLIAEHITKPNIPNIPSSDAYVKIDDLARDVPTRLDADSIAGTFGYPEDQSYSADLQAYDDSGRLGHAIDQMRELGTKYADAESHGDSKEYYIRREALEKAAEICDSFEFSMVRPLIDAFTDAGNDYEKEDELEAYDIAGRISLHSGKVASTYGDPNYSDLYDGTINESKHGFKTYQQRRPTKGSGRDHDDCVKEVVRMLSQLDDPATQWIIIERKARLLCREKGVLFGPVFYEALSMFGLQ